MFVVSQPICEVRTLCLTGVIICKNENPEDEIFDLDENEVKMVRSTLEVISKCEKIRYLMLSSYNYEHNMICFVCNWPKRMTLQGCSIYYYIRAYVVEVYW